jgi:hypothetical protein
MQTIDMAKKNEDSLDAKTFAVEMGIHYRTALIWLRKGLVPGAEEIETPMGNYWKIPRAALTMEKPKPGPKPKADKQFSVKTKRD